jgi:hypothetical protein
VACNTFLIEQIICEIPANWKTRIDLIVEDTYDTTKVAAGGPTCFYHGKEIPCSNGSSPKASIISQLLVDMLKQTNSWITNN